MAEKLFSVGFIVTSILLPHNIHVLAAPSVEACPNDSILVENVCKCHLESCIKPPCQTQLIQISNGTNEPGNCCPTYSCTECEESSLLNGKCPCAPGATLNGHKCECVDREKELINGECVCNPSLCELDQICDIGSVRVQSEASECCKKSECIPCPQDSYAANKNTNILEEICVCYPCEKNECGVNQDVVIKKIGSSIPGNCCDLYECHMKSNNSCKYNHKYYANGAQWNTPEMKCICNHGIALCKQLSAEKNCVIDGKVYKEQESWTTENGCTMCRCQNGRPKCISHFCEVKESKIKPSICPPLTNCYRVCPNGYKVNKKGCQLCKCNNTTVYNEILDSFNLSVSEIRRILDDYMKNKSMNEAEESDTERTTSGTSPIPFTTNSLDPTVTKTEEKRNGIAFLIVAIAILIVFIVVVFSIYCFCCRKLKQQYKTVNNNNNNLLDQSIEHEKYKKVATKL